MNSPLKVRRLGAFCSLERELLTQVDIKITEFMVLTDGRRITVDRGRGLSIAAVTIEGDTSSHPSPFASLSYADLEVEVRAVVGFRDDLASQHHQWKWMISLLSAQGVHSSTEELMAVPYIVHFDDGISKRLSPD